MNSIHHFFSEIGCQFQCYNMGRLIHPIEQQEFIHFENNQSPYYSPFLQQAWLAIVFWQEKESLTSSTSDYYVWFLKLPLDEQAQLNLTARDYFLRCLLSALDQKQKNMTEKLHSLENALKDNPYGFQPTEEQMANFHAMVHQQFSLNPSSFYQKTQEYLANKQNLSHWQQVGFQGIADISTRLDETDHKGHSNEQLIINALPHLPLASFQAFAICLENQTISKTLTQAIYKKVLFTFQLQTANKALSAELTQVCILSIRATAQSEDIPLQQQLLHSILTSEIAQDIELLATIATRCWQQLHQQSLLSLFLEALADSNNTHQQQHSFEAQTAFNTMLSDLMFIPGMREPILKEFRSTQRSQKLTQAIGLFFNQAALKQNPTSTRH
ncbi:MAG: DUF3549 family protein [Gammaproteobacteria bacterium]|nr:DUF3549 family protein [Gammaproteobacteria bacterium]